MILKPISERLSRVFILGTLLILITILTAKSQNNIIEIGSTRISAEKIIQAIEKQTHYRFAYSKTLFDASRVIDLKDTNITVREALDGLVKNTNVSYVLQDNYIAFIPSQPVKRVQVHAPRTSDVYQGNDPNSISSSTVNRPQTEQSKPATVIQPEQIEERVFPQSHSAYTPIDGYSKIQTSQPKWAIKTNLLYYAALTPNLGVEFAVGQKSTLELMGSYSWYGREKKTLNDTKQFVHSIYRAEYRRWLCERFNGHYIGGHALFSIYNVSGLNVPMLFEKDYRYDGTAIGAGFTYGYNLPIAKRLNLEFAIGVGAAYMKYDRYTCELCDKNPESKSKFYIGPTRAGINLIFLLK